MTLAAILCQAGTIGGTLAASDHHSLAVLPPGHVHLNIYVAFDPHRVPVIRWDGGPPGPDDLRVGVPLRVDYEDDPLSPKGGRTATRVVLGPPIRTPWDAEDEAFVVAQEQLAAGTCTSPRQGLDDETAAVIEDLGAPSHAARERATGEMRGWPRERLVRALAWALGVRWPRRTGAEIRHRAAGIARARWITIGDAP